MVRKKISILVVDDDPSIRNMLDIILTKEGYNTLCVESGLTALKEVKEKSFDLIFSDIKMPDMNGLDLLEKVKSIAPEVPVIMITAYASSDDAVNAMKNGAEDYITKPFNIDELKLLIDRVVYKKDIEKENIDLKKIINRDRSPIITGDKKLQKILEMIRGISQTDSSVLIIGESGTGKELIANEVHNRSTRCNNPFVSVNCGAIPENLLESELFGHVKGAFTDAWQDKEGLFQQAEGGTLFLDEIGEMTPSMQVKLLRVIQERNVRKVGGGSEVPVDVRIISATNIDLAESVKNGSFRADLFYRINVIPITVPPLRDRKEDISLLMNHFLEKYCIRFRKEILGFEPDVAGFFMKHQWPGNVRELENMVERAVALCCSNTITMDLITLTGNIGVSDSSNEMSIREQLMEGDIDFYGYIDDVSRTLLKEALDMNDNNLKKTAEKLKLSYRSIRYMVNKFKLK